MKAYRNFKNLKFTKQRSINLSQAPYLLYKSQSVNKYTIEKTIVAHCITSIRIGVFKRLYAFIHSFFGGDSNFLAKHYYELIRFEAMRSLYDQATSKANFISNLDLKISKIGNNLLVAEATADVMYLFPDSISTYEFSPDIPEIQNPKATTISRAFLAHNIIALVIICHLCLSTIFSNLEAARNNFDRTVSQTTWLNIQERYREKALNYAQNERAYSISNAVLDKLPKLPPIRNFNFEVIIIKSNELDAYILPDGKFIITNQLLAKLKSEDALAFLMAKDLAHLANGSFIRAQGSKIISIYWINNLIGPNLAGRALMYLYDLSNIKYSSEQSSEAQDYALISLDNVYNNVKGAQEIYELFIQLPDSPYTRRHNIEQLGLAPLTETIANQNLPVTNTKEVFFDIEDANHLPLNNVTPHMNNIDGTELLKRFNNEFNEVINQYQADMQLLSDVLRFSNDNISDKDLVLRINSINSARDKIRLQQQNLDALTKSYEGRIAELEKSIPESQYQLLTSRWVKERDFAKTLSDFYTDRDYQLLKLQELALRFLRKRQGNFTISEGKIIFNSALSQSNFNDIMNNINQLQYSKPPQKEY